MCGFILYVLIRNDVCRYVHRLMYIVLCISSYVYRLMYIVLCILSFTAIITSIRQSIFDINTKLLIQLVMNCPKDIILMASTLYWFCLAKLPVGLWCIQNEKKLVKSYP